MDLFEILFVLMFLLIPLFQGMRKRPDAQGPTPTGRLPRETPTHDPARPDRSSGGAETVESGPAADMVPDDLWELLTGERRARGAPAESLPGEPAASAEEPWSTAPEWAPESRHPDLDVSPSWDTDPVPLSEQGPGGFEGATLERQPLEPVSLEYSGPEAYSLEGPPPPPEVRHTQFHDKMDRLPARPAIRRAATPPLLRALTRPQGLRDAVVLAEVLGPPKGLD